MNNIESTKHQNHQSAPSACTCCLGIQGHEAWCVTRDPNVHYAYSIVLEPRKLTIGDSLILHSLGVTWSDLAVGR
ncbi:MAG: hypothetical protein WA485_27075 [Candidatus Sulfotelmatobacter sp.]